MHTFGFSGASLLALMSLRREQIVSGRFGDDWQQHCVVGKQMSVDESSLVRHAYIISSQGLFCRSSGRVVYGI